MARFNKIQTLTAMTGTGMVPVFYHSDIEVCKKVLKACYDGGVRAFEFTNRGDFAHEVFAELMKYSAKECPEMVLGAGTVVDAGTASLYIQMGASFIVGPLRTGGRLRPDQGLPRRQCGRSLICQERARSHVMEHADSNRCG